jgi:beta-galactosidase
VPGIRLVRGGMEIGGEVVPLYAGSVHYWRLERADWRACLEATRALGLRMVDIYVPWAVHEISPGVLELGERDPQRDVVAFLRLAHELGLYAIVRPGPHINAELTCFGIPERVVWDASCQARSPKQSPVMLPMVPHAFPVPSYASEAFHDEAARFFQALAPALAPLVWPAGPIVLLQIDNEGALYFRDGAYDQDYHPDAIALYRGFLRDKYKTLDALEAAYGQPPPHAPRADGEGPASEPAPRFATLEPPVRFDAETPRDLPRHLDWSEFHEHLLATALERFARALGAGGMPRLPTMHNLPIGQETTPLNVARMTRAVDLVGLDYYHTAGERSRATIARRTSELAVRCDALELPAFACEMGAGFPPFFPPLEERDSAFTVMAALAYGLRGFNIYMAVERDRWIGAPIDRRGRARPFAAFWTKLCAALEQTRFHTLRRRAPVRLLTPRSERRLARVMHAFGPLTGAVFSVLGAGARESCLEDDLGLGYSPPIETEAFVRAFDAALEARGVPFAHIGGEDREVSMEGARWIICATSGGMNPALFARLEEAAQAGVAISVGPRAPTLDGSLRQLSAPLDAARLAGDRGVPLVVDLDPAAADAAVARAVEALALPTLACDPDSVFATVHEDDDGAPRVLFLLNPTDTDLVASVTVQSPAGAGVVASARDALDDTTFGARSGAEGQALFEVRIKPRTVRMLALDTSEVS